MNKPLSFVQSIVQSNTFVEMLLLSLMTGVWFAADYVSEPYVPDESVEVPIPAPAPPAPPDAVPAAPSREIPINPVTGEQFRDRPIKLRR